MKKWKIQCAQTTKCLWVFFENSENQKLKKNIKLKKIGRLKMYLNLWEMLTCVFKIQVKSL